MNATRDVPVPTYKDLVSYEANQTWAAGQLMVVRTAASKWQTGLAAVLGLTTTVLVVKGPNSIEGLTVFAKVLAAALVGLSLLVGLGSLLLILAAANGFPRYQRMTDTEPAVLELRSARLSGRYLRLGVVGTVVTVLLIAASVGVTWFGAQNSGPVVRAQLTDGSIVCGGLIQGGPDNFTLSGTGGYETFAYGQLKAFTIESACSR